MTYVLMDRHLGLINGSSFEMMVSQMQAYTTKILVVKDGCTLLVLDSSNQIPTYLKLELIKPNLLVRTQEFHYRDTQSDELWVFFHPDLHTWIQEGREDMFRLELSRVTESRQDFETVTHVEDDFQMVKKIPSASSSTQISQQPQQLQPYDVEVTDSEEDLAGFSINVADTDNLSPVDELVVSRSYADTSNSHYI